MKTDVLSELYTGYTRIDHAVALSIDLWVQAQTAVATAHTLLDRARRLQAERLTYLPDPLPFISFPIPQAGTVLVVDDDEAIREFITQALSDEGYHVITASDGAIALALIQQHRPGVILLDMRMPIMDGPAFLAQYSLSKDPQAPVIAMSANTVSPQSTRLVKQFIPKPFDLSVLLDCVKQYAALSPA